MLLNKCNDQQILRIYGMQNNYEKIKLTPYFSYY